MIAGRAATPYPDLYRTKLSPVDLHCRQYRQLTPDHNRALSGAAESASHHLWTTSCRARFQDYQQVTFALQSLPSFSARHHIGCLALAQQWHQTFGGIRGAGRNQHPEQRHGSIFRNTAATLISNGELCCAVANPCWAALLYHSAAPELLNRVLLELSGSSERLNYANGSPPSANGRHCSAAPVQSTGGIGAPSQGCLRKQDIWYR